MSSSPAACHLRMWSSVAQLDAGDLVTRRDECAFIASIEQPGLQFERPTDTHEVARDRLIDARANRRNGGRIALKSRESFGKAACQPVVEALPTAPVR